MWRASLYTHWTSWITTPGIAKYGLTESCSGSDNMEVEPGWQSLDIEDNVATLTLNDGVAQRQSLDCDMVNAWNAAKSTKDSNMCAFIMEVSDKTLVITSPVLCQL